MAYGGKTRLKWLNGNNIILDGVSFACPKVIVDLLNADIKQIDYDNAIELFKRKSRMIIKYKNLFYRNNIKGKTACFPFNKEIYSILRFNNNFDITCVLDFKGRGVVGRRCSDFIDNLSYTNEINDMYILDSEDKDNFNEFDNILIGDISQLLALYGEKIYTCLKRLYDAGKKIYSFLPYNELYPDIKIYSPTTIDNNIFDKKYAKCSSIAAGLLNLIPVVAIVGTSKNQGKYTLQQRIKRCLASTNIKAAFLSTEHQGIFLNDDGCFPYGAGKYSLVNLSLERFYALYDYLLFSLSLKKCDIIIAGLQSGILTEHHKYRKYVIHNLSMLSMMMPETSVVIVNSQDSYLSLIHI